LRVRKLCVVVTARPSFARIRTVLDALRTDPDVDLRIIMAASTLLHHYGHVERDCPYRIAHRIYSTLDGLTPETSATETGLLTIQLATVFASEHPDCVVTIADRHETLATAIAASYQNIPLAHIQGGESSGNIDDRVRHAVSHLADLHFPATGNAAARLDEMRVNGPIFQYGCPSIDLAARATPDRMHDGAIVVLQHAVTNEVEDAQYQIEETLTAMRLVSARRVIWFWPGQDAGSEGAAKRLREEAQHHPRIEFKRHLPAPAFLSMLRSCACLVGNSSVGIRECGYFGTPVIDIGTRQTGRDHGPNVYHVPHVASEITRALRYQLDHGRYPQSTLYGNGTAGPRIAAALTDPAALGIAEHLECGPRSPGQRGGAGQKPAPIGEFNACRPSPFHGG
jgi:UDP-hydrolysing UDP-N-acetyl-D-glucosamine 2-epimerase